MALHNVIAKIKALKYLTILSLIFFKKQKEMFTYLPSKIGIPLIALRHALMSSNISTAYTLVNKWVT